MKSIYSLSSTGNWGGKINWLSQPTHSSPSCLTSARLGHNMNMREATGKGDWWKEMREPCKQTAALPTPGYLKCQLIYMLLSIIVSVSITVIFAYSCIYCKLRTTCTQISFNELHSSNQCANYSKKAIKGLC